jgi:putative oxidoreductase
MATKHTNYRDIGILIIRIGLGIMFIYHGYPKLGGGIKMWQALGGATNYVGIYFWPALWGFLAAVVETFGGFLLLLGLAFRPVCLLLVINLVVAIAMTLGKGEGIDGAAHAIEDAVVFAGLFFTGPGRYSVDKK